MLLIIKVVRPSSVRFSRRPGGSLVMCQDSFTRDSQCHTAPAEFTHPIRPVSAAPVPSYGDQSAILWTLGLDDRWNLELYSDEDSAETVARGWARATSRTVQNKAADVLGAAGTPGGVCPICKNEPEKLFRINKSAKKRTQNEPKRT
jgi:hypothetical protein